MQGHGKANTVTGFASPKVGSYSRSGKATDA